MPNAKSQALAYLLDELDLKWPKDVDADKALINTTKCLSRLPTDVLLVLARTLDHLNVEVAKFDNLKADVKTACADSRDPNG